MKILSIYLVVIVCVLGSTFGQTDDTESPTGETVETNVPTGPSSSAPKEETTKPDDTSPTEPSSPTTTAIPETTAPTTTPKPDTTTPPATLSEGKWIVEENATTCIRMDMALTFTIQYETKNNTTKSVSFDLPGTQNLSKTGGHCAKDSKDSNERISIAWQGITGWNVTFDFTKNDKKYHCNQITFEFTMQDAQFPDIKEEEKVDSIKAIHNESIWEVDVSNSWQCDSNDSVSGKFYDDKKKNAVQEMTTKGLQLQAFATGDSLKKDFADPIPCPADSTVSNIVPIAVGAALAALVVIVLIAYLIGRRRNKRGYESV